MNNQKAIITKQEITEIFKRGTLTLLSLKIFYPRAELPGSPKIQGLISGHYREEANTFYKYASGSLLTDARVEYINAVKSGFPFRPYDALMTYSVELNEGCHLSTYYEQYTYTGGAHGTTVRRSDNWDLNTGRRLRMKDLFPDDPDYLETVQRQVLQMADRRMAADPHVYFEDYRELIVKYFDPQSFYLTPKGMAIYYQLYEIAPYVSGIVTFTIPYAALNIEKPYCGGPY